MGGSGFRHRVQPKNAVIFVSCNFGHQLLLQKLISLVYFDSLVLQTHSLRFEVGREEHPSKNQDHAYNHNGHLFGLLLFGLVFRDEEEDDQHVPVGEEEVDPVLCVFEGVVFDLYVVVFL